MITNSFALYFLGRVTYELGMKIYCNNCVITRNRHNKTFMIGLAFNCLGRDTVVLVRL